MTGLIEMMLLRAMSASAAREEASKRKRQKNYDIDGEDIRELKVLKIVYFCDSYSMGCLRVGSIEETTRRNITVFDIEIGKHVFFTREEAEAELKKRRKEVNTT